MSHLMPRFALLLPLALLAGCQSKPSLVGDWTVPIESLGTVKANFASGGAMTLKGSALGYGITIAGTYQSSDAQLTVEPKDVSIDGDIPAMFKDAAQKEIDGVKDKPVSFAVKWNDADSVSLEPIPGTPASRLNQKLTLTRVKN